MLFAAIFVPDFPVEAVLRAEPELRSQAVAVLEGKPPLQKIFAVNERAHRAGVEPGMAKLQVETCTEVALRVRSAALEAAAHAALLDCAQSFSPRVEDTACDTLVLDLDGLEALFGPPVKIARDLAHRACDFGMEVNVAVASNPDAAVLAARGFSGITVIPAGKEVEPLGGLPVDVLFAGLEARATTQDPEQLLETLERWGVRNLRALAALPEVALSERMGQHGVYLQQLARGATSRTLVPVDPPTVFEEAGELEHPVVLLEPLAFLLNRMLEQICARLAARALATQEVRLELQLGQGWNEEAVLGRTGEDERPSPKGTLIKQKAGFSTPQKCSQTRIFAPLEMTTEELHQSSSMFFQRTLRLPVPLLDPRIFLKLLQLDLKANPPGAPIVGIRLRAEPVRPRAAQGGLFVPPAPEPEKLELTLARIAGIVGEGRAGCVEILDTHRPEGFRMQRFAAEPQGQKPATQSEAPNATLKALRHPKADTITVTALRIFRPPVQVAVTLHAGRPERIDCPRKKELQGDVLWAAGPWRSSGDWWQKDGWVRDEWDIAVQAGHGIALYRLVRDLLSGKWIVEGVYD